ncbi:MAG: ribosome maturation factor RimP [Clostridia bacterium]|jgi:ribosome maturation factor RimP|nr:ribosome maturation factor RimP [Clostridia bacterium]MDD4571469.1 ribosome maturation factor RimP [Clostridia bacterium]
MSKTNIAEIVEKMVEPICIANGCEVVDVEWLREGGERYLRIYIDRLTTPVDLDLCEKVSRAVSKVLDQNDPTDCNYILEVSSPGIERPLKKPADFERFKGERVTIRLFKAWEGIKEYTGILAGLNDEGIAITIEGNKIITIPRDRIAKVHLSI